MGWKGTTRSAVAFMRRMDREAQRAQRERARHQKHLQKLAEIEEAGEAVARYEEYIQRITSLHRDRTCDVIDWRAVAGTPEPNPPERRDKSEAKALARLDSYQPGKVASFLGRAEKQRKRLADKVEHARTLDELEHHSRVRDWERAHADWAEDQRLCAPVLNGDRQARLDVIERVSPFSSIHDLGAEVRFDFSGDVLTAEIQVESEDIVPTERYSQLTSGKLSTRKLPKGQYYEIYQDYVCGALLRVASELMAILPDRRLIVSACDDLLNPATGHVERQVILSVDFRRDTMVDLNLPLADPSDAVTRNFNHRMDFKKTKGFAPVDAIAASD